MITIEIPQGQGQKPGIYFRPATIEATPRGQIAKRHFEALVAELSAPTEETAAAPASEASDVAPDAPPAPVPPVDPDPTKPVVTSAPDAQVKLGDRTPANDPVNNIFNVGGGQTVTQGAAQSEQASADQAGEKGQEAPIEKPEEQADAKDKAAADEAAQ